MARNKQLKIAFLASTGGHYEQLMMLNPLMEKFLSCIVTEQTSYTLTVNQHKHYFLKQVNRKEWIFLFKFFLNTLISLKIFVIEQPDVLISTGALSTIPLLFIGKLCRKKIIFIESFAKINSPTLTGKLIYKIADQFYVQWEEMLEIYPEAIYKGSLY